MLLSRAKRGMKCGGFISERSLNGDELRVRSIYREYLRFLTVYAIPKLYTRLLSCHDRRGLTSFIFSPFKDAMNCEPGVGDIVHLKHPSGSSATIARYVQRKHISW